MEKTLPRGIDIETYEKAKSIIVSGFENNATPDDIKSAMFGQGIKFSDLVRLYKAITVNENLVLSDKEINEKVDAVLENELDISNSTTNEDLTYEAIEPALTSALEVKGSTAKRVAVRCARYLAEYDLVMPKKPKTSKTRTGKVNKTILDVFAANKEATKEEFTTAIEAVTSEKNAKIVSGKYRFFFCLANGIGSDKV